MSVKLLTEQYLELLSLKGGCTGLSEATLVKMPHCWKSRFTAHMGSNPRKPSSGVWEQHRGRPACTSVQSDQRLCFSLFGKYPMKTCYRCNFNFLASI